MPPTIATAWLHGDSTFSDITIKYGKGKEVKGHKLVLACGSERFKELLKDAAVNIITLDADDDEAAVKLMLRYIYTSSIDGDPTVHANLRNRLHLSLLDMKYGIRDIDEDNNEAFAERMGSIDMSEPEELIDCIRDMPPFMPEQSFIARQIYEWFGELRSYNTNTYLHTSRACTVHELLEMDGLRVSNKFFQEILLRADVGDKLTNAGIEDQVSGALDEIRKRFQDCEKCRSCAGDVAYEAFMGTGWAKPLPPPPPQETSTALLKR